MRRVVVAAVFSGAVACAANGEADQSGRGWRPVRLDLEVTVQPEAWRVRVRGETTLRLEGREESAGPTIGVNSRQPCVVFESARCEGAKVELNATTDKLPSARLAHVRFASPKRKGDSVVVKFECAVPGHEGQLVATPAAALASWTSGWYPIALPEDDEGTHEVNRAPGTMVFHLPKAWGAVTGGKRVSREERGDETVETWEVPNAIARSFAAAEYRTLEGKAMGVNVSVSLITKDSPYAEDQIGALVRAVDALQERLGPYPYPGFAIAEVPDDVGNFGASSEQGFIMVKPNFLDCKGGNLALFAHEAAHAWWGNTVGTRGEANILCDESLAQYGCVIAIEKFEGPEGVRSFLDFSRESYIHSQCAKGYFEVVKAGKDIPLSKLKSGGINHLLSDSKGHWVYHMLRQRVGDEVFFGTLRELIRTYSGKEMSIGDVRAAFIKAAPEAGLEKFFEQWLDRAGAPKLEIEWNQEGDTGSPVRVSGVIRQVQEGEPFELDLEVGLELADGGKEMRRVRLSGPTQSFGWRVPGRIARVELDPEHKLLIWREAYEKSGR